MLSYSWAYHCSGFRGSNPFSFAYFSKNDRLVTTSRQTASNIISNNVERDKKKSHTQ